MSYEGFSQFICMSSHYFTIDAHDDYERKPKCPHCGEEAVWRNGVDQTNCCTGAENCAYDLPLEEARKCEGNGIGFIELEEDTPPVMCECEKCGHKHEIEPPTYKIPEGKGWRLE